MAYHDLNVYQKAYKLSLEIHVMSLGFPKFEQYELGQQMRKSSKSIVANIAEGMGKQESALEVKRFIKMSIGSCDETTVWLMYAKDLGYISNEQYQEMLARYQEVGRMLTGIVKRYIERA